MRKDFSIKYFNHMFGFFKKDEEPSDIPFNEYNHDRAIDLLRQSIDFIKANEEKIVEVLEKSLKKTPVNKTVMYREKEVAKRALNEIVLSMRKHSLETYGRSKWNWGVILPSCAIEAVETLKSLYGYSDAWGKAISYPFINIIEKNIAPLWKKNDNGKY